jgi:hypothetical protein
LKRAAFALALAGAVSAGGADSARPGVEADGAPDPDPALVRAVSGYLKFGTTRFQDWRPGRRDLLVSTRAGSIEQLHLLTRPEAVPRAWSAFPEPVAEARFRPGFENELAFTSDVAGNEWHQLSWMNAERGRVRPVSDGDGRVSGFRWSNDGRWLVWGAVDRDGATTALMVMDAEPRSARHVCLLPGSGWVPLDVSRDGGRILVCEFRSVRDSRLWIVDAATGDRRMAGAATDGPVASPGGRFTRDGLNCAPGRQGGWGRRSRRTWRRLT